MSRPRRRTSSRARRPCTSLARVSMTTAPSRPRTRPTLTSHCGVARHEDPVGDLDEPAARPGAGSVASPSWPHASGDEQSAGSRCPIRARLRLRWMAMSLDTRTARRQARHRRNLVVGAVVGLATAVSAALVGALLVAAGPDQPPSAGSSVGPSSSGWSAHGRRRPGRGRDVGAHLVGPRSARPARAPPAPERHRGGHLRWSGARGRSGSATGLAASAGASPSADPTSPQAGRTVVTADAHGSRAAVRPAAAHPHRVAALHAPTSPRVS